MKRCAHLGLMTLMCWCVSGQSQTVTPAFDAASIKPTPPDGSNITFRLGPNSLSTRGVLGTVVMLAYQVTGYQVAGGPAWTWSASYDIQAEAGGAADSQQIRLMLRTLLADRFQLKLHRETRMIAGYVLGVDKGGPRLPPARTDVPPDDQDVQPIRGGGIQSRGSPIKSLAIMLGMQLGKPVVDETKIEGNYDFRLRFDDSNQTGVGIPSEFASVFEAIHEIGLKLEAKKIPLEVLVIDSVERPSDN